MLVFELEDALGECFDCVVGIDGAVGLKYNVAVVVVFIDAVDGDARFRFTGGQYGLVYPDAVHALSAELGQQGRVNVQDLVGVCLYKRWRQLPQKSGQDQPRYLFFPENGQVSISLLKAFSG